MTSETVVASTASGALATLSRAAPSTAALNKNGTPTLMTFALIKSPSDNITRLRIISLSLGHT